MDLGRRLFVLDGLHVPPMLLGIGRTVRRKIPCARS
jgi:hypothetical protein